MILCLLATAVCACTPTTGVEMCSQFSLIHYFSSVAFSYYSKNTLTVADNNVLDWTVHKMLYLAHKWSHGDCCFWLLHVLPFKISISAKHTSIFCLINCVVTPANRTVNRLKFIRWLKMKVFSILRSTHDSQNVSKPFLVICFAANSNSKSFNCIAIATSPRQSFALFL